MATASPDFREGRRRAALRFGREIGLVLGGLGLAVFLVYHFTVHTIRNRRPIAGPNVAVAPPGFGTQSEASFAADPARPRVLFGTLAASLGGSADLAVFVSNDGGLHWRRTAGPTLPAGSCFYAGAKAVADRAGREYLAFLASPCVQTETPYLVVTSRAGPSGPWRPVTRVAPRIGKYGFDDGPSLALDPRSGRLYLAWARAVGRRLELVTSESADRGRTWSAPRPVSDALVDPHLAQVAVERSGAVVAAGIDARLGLWAVRSTDRGLTFTPPRTIARLIVNPARDRCALSIDGPLPFELTRCVGPNPSLLPFGGRILVVYGDVGDVFAVSLDDRLRPMTTTEVNPLDRGKTQQFFPVAATAAGRIWACWYDTTFDPHAHRVWFTCSASSTGRSWSAPERAAAAPTDPLALYTSLPIEPSVVATGTDARAFWPDYSNARAGLRVLTAPLR